MSQMVAVVHEQSTGEALAPADLLGAARDYAKAAKAENTRRAYRGDWGSFSNWCNSQGWCPLPASAETVALYVTARARAGRKVATLVRELASVSQAHKAAGLRLAHLGTAGARSASGHPRPRPAHARVRCRLAKE